jgi:hypothetical protein
MRSPAASARCNGSERADGSRPGARDHAIGGATTYRCACGLPERLDVQTGKSAGSQRTLQVLRMPSVVTAKAKRLTAGEPHRGLE